MDGEAKGFIKGIALVIAMVSRTYDQPTMAYEMYNSCGYKIKDMEDAGVDNFDLIEIQNMVNSESKPFQEKEHVKRDNKEE